MGDVLVDNSVNKLDRIRHILSDSFLAGKILPAYVGAPDRARISAIEQVLAEPAAAPLSDEETSEALILEALLKVRETGNAGLAGPYVHRLPKDADRNWGWLQGQWGIVLAVDVVQQAYADQMSQLRELAERAHTYGPDEFGAFKRELHKILGELTD